MRWFFVCWFILLSEGFFLGKSFSLLICKKKNSSTLLTQNAYESENSGLDEFLLKESFQICMVSTANTERNFCPGKVFGVWAKNVRKLYAIYQSFMSYPFTWLITPSFCWCMKPEEVVNMTLWWKFSPRKLVEFLPSTSLLHHSLLLHPFSPIKILTQRIIKFIY